MPLSASEIRETFLSFFESRGHRRVASSALVPDADPTLLFTNAGMVQFKDTFLGSVTRPYKRATTSQKCMRVSGKHNDLENVGRTPRHHTFFEMLGNFSFGDYFKQEAIEFAWELVTRGLGIDPKRLVASVFRDDDEAFGLWHQRIGLPAEKIFRLDEQENFWSMGDTGPCGPCSEIHVDFGRKPQCQSAVCSPACNCGRFLEIWNLVFMQFDRDASGTLTPLPKPSIDTGAGLERLAAVIQGAPSNYDTDLFRPILERAQEISGVSRGQNPEQDVSLHVIADHARAVSFLIGDGVLPSNEGRGYVLRRILRRASRHGYLLGQKTPFLHRVADAVIDEMAAAYPELGERRAFIASRIEREEGRFLETLAKGIALLDEEVARLVARGVTTLPGDVVFKLYDTFGFPVDLTADILASKKLALDQVGFDRSMGAQRARARAAWKGSGDEQVGAAYGRLAADLQTSFEGYDRLALASTIRALLVDGRVVDEATQGQEVEIIVDETPFYAESGGQVGDRGLLRSAGGGQVSIRDTQKPVQELWLHRGRVVAGRIGVEERVELEVDASARQATVRNHSGTHLLHAALRKCLGPQVMQKGSLVGPERLRFDFTHDAALTREEIAEVEDLANQWIEQNAHGETRHMRYADAVASGAMAIFEEKYGEEVRVVSFGEQSTELCGGTHARATGDIGLLKILSESGIASGVRRIEALTGLGALAHIRQEEYRLEEAARLLKSPVGELATRIERLLEERRQLERELAQWKSASRGAVSADLSSQVELLGGLKVVAARVDGTSASELRGMIDDLRGKLGSGVVLLAAEEGGKVALALGVTKDLCDRLKAGDLIREVAAVVGGKGGGRPDFAQAGGPDASRIDAALARFRELVGG